MDFSRVQALTFDCYGTLIDWESGILTALRAMLGETPTPDDELLQMYARFEPEAEAGAFRPYRAVLTDVAVAFGRELGVPLSGADAAAFAESVGDWPAFPDTPDALRALSERFRLGIVSNVDDDLFTASAERLGASFDVVVTAQQVRSYKPNKAHFREALSRLDVPREAVVHVAQSLYHDIAPATELGFACIWVNRRSGLAGGATPPATVVPDVEVADLAGLASLIGVT